MDSLHCCLTFYRSNDSFYFSFRLIDNETIVSWSPYIFVSAAQLSDDDIVAVHFVKFQHLLIQIILQSMHKYKPRVHIIRHDPRMDLSQIQSLPAEGVHSFSFPETEFTTVTAYQNQQVTLTQTGSHVEKNRVKKLCALCIKNVKSFTLVDNWSVYMFN